jgi:hypothetical protein
MFDLFYVKGLIHMCKDPYLSVLNEEWGAKYQIWISLCMQNFKYLVEVKVTTEGPSWVINIFNN